MANAVSPKGYCVSPSTPISLFGASPIARRGSLFSMHRDGQPEPRDRQLKLFKRKPSDTADPGSAPVEVPIEWDTARQFILFPDGKGGPVKLPSTQQVQRPSSETVKKFRQGQCLDILLGSKITPATEISHEWGYEGSIMLYDPEDPEEASVEYVYLTDHLDEDPETRQHVLSAPKSNLFFITLKEDNLPTFHFWRDVENDGDPRDASDFDWATYMDQCASRRASQQLEVDTTRVAGELHRRRAYFDDDDDDEDIESGSLPRLDGTRRATSFFASHTDSADDFMPVDQSPRRKSYNPTNEDFLFTLGSGESSDYDETLHRPSTSKVFGSSGDYYVCPPQFADYRRLLKDDALMHVMEQFEEDLQANGLAATLKTYEHFIGAAKPQPMHSFDQLPPKKPPKGNWAIDRAEYTVAYKLAMASDTNWSGPLLTGTEPWTRDDTKGYWNSTGANVPRTRLQNRYHPSKEGPMRYRRPPGVDKDNNKNQKPTNGLFQTFRDHFGRYSNQTKDAAPDPDLAPEYSPAQPKGTTPAIPQSVPAEITPSKSQFASINSWVPSASPEEMGRLRQNINKLHPRDRRANLRAHFAPDAHPAVRRRAPRANIPTGSPLKSKKTPAAAPATGASSSWEAMDIDSYEDTPPSVNIGPNNANRRPNTAFAYDERPSPRYDSIAATRDKDDLRTSPIATDSPNNHLLNISPNNVGRGIGRRNPAFIYGRGNNRSPNFPLSGSHGLGIARDGYFSRQESLSGAAAGVSAVPTTRSRWSRPYAAFGDVPPQAAAYASAVGGGLGGRRARLFGTGNNRLPNISLAGSGRGRRRGAFYRSPESGPAGRGGASVAFDGAWLLHRPRERARGENEGGEGESLRFGDEDLELLLPPSPEEVEEELVDDFAPRVLRLWDGMLLEARGPPDPDLVGESVEWKFGPTGWGEEKRKEGHRAFWEAVEELVGPLDKPLKEVELKVYSEVWGWDSVWVDCEISVETWEEIVATWLDGHDTDDIYLVPVEWADQCWGGWGAGGTLHRTRTPGLRPASDFCKCGFDMRHLSMGEYMGHENWHREIRKRSRKAKSPGARLALKMTVNAERPPRQFLANKRATGPSSFRLSDSASSKRKKRGFPTRCKTCNSRIVDLNSLATHYKVHFRGRDKAEMLDHACQSKLEEDGWTHKCSVCGLGLNDFTKAEYKQHYIEHGAAEGVQTYAQKMASQNKRARSASPQDGQPRPGSDDRPGRGPGGLFAANPDATLGSMLASQRKSGNRSGLFGKTGKGPGNFFSTPPGRNKSSLYSTPSTSTKPLVIGEVKAKDLSDMTSPLDFRPSSRSLHRNHTGSHQPRALSFPPAHRIRSADEPSEGMEPVQQRRSRSAGAELTELHRRNQNNEGEKVTLHLHRMRDSRDHSRVVADKRNEVRMEELEGRNKEMKGRKNRNLSPLHYPSLTEELLDELMARRGGSPRRRTYQRGKQVSKEHADGLVAARTSAQHAKRRAGEDGEEEPGEPLDVEAFPVMHREHEARTAIEHDVLRRGARYVEQLCQDASPEQADEAERLLEELRELYQRNRLRRSRGLPEGEPGFAAGRLEAQLRVDELLPGEGPEHYHERVHQQLTQYDRQNAHLRPAAEHTADVPTADNLSGSTLVGSDADGTPLHRRRGNGAARSSIREFLTNSFERFHHNPDRRAREQRRRAFERQVAAYEPSEVRAAVQAEERIRADIDAMRRRHRDPPLAWPPISAAHIVARRDSMRYREPLPWPHEQAEAEEWNLANARRVLDAELDLRAAAGREHDLTLTDNRRVQWHRKQLGHLERWTRAQDKRRRQGRRTYLPMSFDENWYRERVREGPASSQGILAQFGGERDPAFHEARVMRRRGLFERNWAAESRWTPEERSWLDNEAFSFDEGTRRPGEWVLGYDLPKRKSGQRDGESWGTLHRARGAENRWHPYGGGEMERPSRSLRSPRELFSPTRRLPVGTVASPRSPFDVFAPVGAVGGEDDGEAEEPEALYRTYSAPEPETESESEDGSGEDIVANFSPSDIPEGLRDAIASGCPVREIEDNWLATIRGSKILSYFWDRLRTALVLDEQLRRESDAERARSAAAATMPTKPTRPKKVFFADGQLPRLADGGSGVLGEVVDVEVPKPRDATRAPAARKMTPKLRPKKRAVVEDKSYRPVADDEEDDDMEGAEEVVEESAKKARKKRKGGEADETYRPDKKMRVEEDADEYEQTAEVKKRKGAAKGKGAKKTATVEVTREPTLEPEAAPLPAPKSRGRATYAAKDKSSGKLELLAQKAAVKDRDARSGEPSPEPERAAEGAKRYSLRHK
ncbi:hypothetical protein B0J12DRAFT_375578 [Macrophomina phaseolina]|uniref:C2H2-type domain-containing protein n=1 Tax=Macrophomina phaseolina TaxID=35725 RepID=A0ABQ8GKB5_9PEZI|nr:hypothetical protein B0J12DRAFT_375578 [Macrophomina phaseolina]